MASGDLYILILSRIALFAIRGGAAGMRFAHSAAPSGGAENSIDMLITRHPRSEEERGRGTPQSAEDDNVKLNTHDRRRGTTRLPSLNVEVEVFICVNKVMLQYYSAMRLQIMTQVGLHINSSGTLHSREREERSNV